MLTLFDQARDRMRHASRHLAKIVGVSPPASKDALPASIPGKRELHGILQPLAHSPSSARCRCLQRVLEWLGHGNGRDHERAK